MDGEIASTTAQAILQAVQARRTVPDRHHPAPLVLLTAKGRYFDEENVFSKSKVSLAGVVRMAKYFRYKEWVAISRNNIVLEAALKWINQADLHEDDYWHHYYKILHRRGDPHARDFLLGTPLLLLLHSSFDSQIRIRDRGVARQCRPLRSTLRAALPRSPYRDHHLHRQRAAD
jgi:hypothetical protein